RGRRRGPDLAPGRVRRRRRDHGAIQADRDRDGRRREGGAERVRPPHPQQQPAGRGRRRGRLKTPRRGCAMNLRDLTYFIALADHLHFGRAAAASFVSQPTLSTQIRKLEEELGVALVERAPRNVMLTPAGRDVAARARRIVADVEAMREAARRSRDPEAGTVTLGLFPTLGPYLLPHVVPDIRRRFPQLELLLVEEKSDVLLERLQQGRLDAALLALPVADEQLEVEFLFEEPFVLAVPETHPLAGRAPLSLAELADERLLLLADGHCLRD